MSNCPNLYWIALSCGLLIYLTHQEGVLQHAWWTAYPS